MPMNTPHAKNAVVTCCSHSQGAPSVRVTTSQNTVSVNMKMHTPQRTINAASNQSNAFHFKWRWRCRIKARKSAISVVVQTSNEHKNPAGDARNAPPVGPRNELLDVPNELEDLHRVRTELLCELILDWLRRFDEARLVDVIDDLHADRLQFFGGILLELQCHHGLGLRDFVGGGLNPLLLL